MSELRHGNWRVELVDGGLNIRAGKAVDALKLSVDDVVTVAGPPEHSEMAGLRTIAESMVGVPGGVSSGIVEPGGIEYHPDPSWLTSIDPPLIKRYAKGAVAVLTALLIVAHQFASGVFDLDAVATAVVAALGALGVIVIPNRSTR